MAYDQPFYNRPNRRFLAGYTTRVLLGMVGSLAITVLLLHLPMSRTPARVGWSSRPAEWIALSEIQEETPPEESSDESNAAPPVTRHAPPKPDASTHTAEGNSGQEATAEEDVKNDLPSPPVQHISALSFDAQKPEIVGGRGALYLQIEYPEQARLKGIEGRLKLHFTVDVDGRVRQIEVGQSLHPLCDSAAVRALRSVRFIPASRDGEPIPVRMTLPIRFELQSNPSAMRDSRLSSSGG